MMIVKGESFGSGVFSEGARYERKAILAKVRRELEYAEIIGATGREQEVYRKFIAWILERRKRYELKSGGLGRKR